MNYFIHTRDIYLHVCRLGNLELQIELVAIEPVHIGGYGFYG